MTEKKHIPVATKMGTYLSKTLTGYVTHDEDRPGVSSRVRSSAKDIEPRSTRQRIGPEITDCGDDNKKKREEAERNLRKCEIALHEKQQELEKIKSRYNGLEEEHRNVLEYSGTQAKELAKKDAEIAYYRHAISREEGSKNRAIGLLEMSSEKYLRPYAEKKGIIVHQWEYPEYLNALGSLVQDASEAEFMQARIHSLQEEMLTTVSKVQASTDEHFAGDFRRIISLVRSFSRTNEVAEHINVKRLLSTGVLQDGVSVAHWNDRARKKVLVEACVWSALIEMIFWSPFECFGSPGTKANSLWEDIYFAEHDNGWPVPTTLCESWRYTTAESMMQLIDQGVMAKGRTENTYKPLDEGVMGIRNHIRVTIEDRLDIPPSAGIAEQLQNIINKSSMLAVEMSLQKYRLQVTYPSVGCEFSNEAMKLLPGFEGDDVDSGKVAFVVNPGLTKWGDTHGKKFDCRYDIVPALVQLETSSRENESGISLI